MKISIGIMVSDASRDQILDLHFNLPERHSIEKSMQVTNAALGNYHSNYINVKYSISRETLDKIVEIFKEEEKE